VRYNEIHRKTHTIDNYLGSYGRACVYSVMCRLKPLYVLAGEFSGVTLGVAGRIRGLAVTLGS
jgi:hypothetical protein